MHSGIGRFSPVDWATKLIVPRDGLPMKRTDNDRLLYLGYVLDIIAVSVNPLPCETGSRQGFRPLGSAYVANRRRGCIASRSFDRADPCVKNVSRSRETPLPRLKSRGGGSERGAKKRLRVQEVSANVLALRHDWLHVGNSET